MWFLFSSSCWFSSEHYIYWSLQIEIRNVMKTIIMWLTKLMTSVVLQKGLVMVALVTTTIRCLQQQNCPVGCCAAWDILMSNVDNLVVSQFLLFLTSTISELALMMAKLPSEEVAMAFQMIRWASLVMTCCSPARRSYSQSLYGSASILATMVVARLKSVLRSGSAAPMTLFPHAMLASSSSAW